MFRIDLHTHSAASPDGSLTMAQYTRILRSHQLDYIAITDHNTIDFALEAQVKLGSAIIVGEEIKSTDGEIIGLYLSNMVKPGLSGALTVKQIHDQGGLVYIPHPLERRRQSMSQTILETLKKHIDIIEIYNGRGHMHWRDRQIAQWAETNGIAKAASSDSHGYRGWGNTYSLLSSVPSAQTLPELLHDATYSLHPVSARGMAYPTINRMRKRKHHVE